MNLEKQIRLSSSVVQEMLRSRGYGAQMDDAQVPHALERALSNHSCHTDNLLALDMGCAVLMYVLQHRQQRMSDIKKRMEALVSSIVKEGIHHTFIVVTHNMSEANINAMCKNIGATCAGHLGHKRMFMQHFYMQELQYNITHHEMVPRHDLVPSSQVPGIVLKHGIRSKHQLPWICKSDPMSKFLGMKPGDVVRITRPSKQAVEYSVYRVCT
jgi:DNA-directed RNA polymerase subunit H